MSANKTPYVIGEIAQAHDGSLGTAHALIDAIASTGADAAKFQMHIADAESSTFEQFRVAFSRQDKTRYDYWKRMEFSTEQWQELKTHCESVGLEFIVSPFSMTAVGVLKSLGLKTYKIGSGEVTNHLMLEAIAPSAKRVFLSSGMSSIAEIEEALGIIKRSKCETTIFQCTSQYPSPPETLGLNLIPEFQKRFQVPIGLSDHSGAIYPSIAAATLGATAFEVHVIFDRRMFGPDSSASLTIEELKDLVRGVRYVHTALANPVDKNNIGQYEEMRRLFGKSLAAIKDIAKGAVVSAEDLETKKPAGHGILPSEYKSVVGKKLKVAKSKGDFIKLEDLE